MTRRTAATLAATGALALTGCGGSPSLSDRDLRQDASAICRQSNVRAELLRTPTTPTAGAQFLRKGISILQPELRALHLLGPPSDLAPQFNTALAQAATALSDIRATVAQIQRGADPINSFRALQQQLAPALAREDGSWRALQIPACISR